MSPMQIVVVGRIVAMLIGAHPASAPVGRLRGVVGPHPRRPRPRSLVRAAGAQSLPVGFFPKGDKSSRAGGTEATVSMTNRAHGP